MTQLTKAIGCMEATLKGRLDTLIAATNQNSSINYTAKFDAMISSLQDIDANTGELETKLTDIKNDTGAITTNTINTVTELQLILTEVVAINANTNGVEGLLGDVIVELQKPIPDLMTGMTADAKCIEVLGVKMWGTPIITMNTKTSILGPTQWLDEDMNPITGVVTTLPSCDCPCTDCSNVTQICTDNPPDHDITDVGGNVLNKAWTTNIAGLSDYAVTDVGGNIMYWAMTTAICATAVPKNDVGSNVTYYIMPA